MMDTDYYRNTSPDCMVSLIDKHNLNVRLDDFGMGKELYQCDLLLGYWFESQVGISFHPALGFMRKPNVYMFETWDAFCKWLDIRLSLLNAKDGLLDEIDRHDELGLRAP